LLGLLPCDLSADIIVICNEDAVFVIAEHLACRCTFLYYTIVGIVRFLFR